MFGIRFPDCSKLRINLKNDNGIKIFRHDVIVDFFFFFFFFFDVVFFLLSNLVTGSSFMSISSLVLVLWQFFYKGLTRNPEIGNTSVWVLPSIGRLGKVRGTKLVTNAFGEMLLNAAKCQGYSFYHF